MDEISVIIIYIWWGGGHKLIPRKRQIFKYRPASSPTFLTQLGSR
jgi:hypothetical protein